MCLTGGKELWFRTARLEDTREVVSRAVAAAVQPVERQGVPAVEPELLAELVPEARKLEGCRAGCPEADGPGRFPLTC